MQRWEWKREEKVSSITKKGERVCFGERGHKRDLLGKGKCEEFSEEG